MITSPVQTPTDATPAAETQEENTQDLLDFVLGDLYSTRESIRETLKLIDHALVPDLKKLKRIAAKKGRIEIVWGADGFIDMRLLAKEGRK